MPISVAFIIGGILALGGTITACILLVPDKKRNTLNKFWRWLHDVFTFKSLLLEHILRVLYIFTTIACLTCGLFLLFSWDYVLVGFITMILGPILVRISYEFMMLIVLLVKKTMNIDNRLSATMPLIPEAPTPPPPPKMNYAPPAQGYAPPPPQGYAPPPPPQGYAPPPPPAAPQAQNVFCGKCGASYPQGQSCPNGC